MTSAPQATLFSDGAKGLNSHPFPITPKQRTALFAAAKEKGLTIHDLRAMFKGSISMASSREAAAVLDRLNAGTPHLKPQASSLRSRRPRRPSNVIAIASPEQYRLIDRVYRVALGWTPDELRGFLAARHYAWDKSRSMNNIVTTGEAGAVIELLKGVLLRTLRYEPRAPASGQLSADRLRELMCSTPAHDRLKRRFEQLRPLTSDLCPLTSGRATPWSCADYAEAVQFLETQLARMPHATAT